MFRIGDIELYLFNDATGWMDPGGLFGLVPRALWSRYYQADSRHLVRSAYHNLLIRHGDRLILVDTGFGNSLSPRQRQRRHLSDCDGTQRSLAALGIKPDEIDIVLDTHLHDDHCGGNMRLNPDGSRSPAYPQATYLVQGREYQDAISPNERTRATYLPGNYQPLYATGQLQLLDGDSEIAPGITAIVTPGHTPAHMSIRIESAGEHAAFVCDLASLAVHFERLAWMSAFDVEPLITLETKRAWQRWALETDALLIFPHDAKTPAGRLSLDERERPRIQPVQIAYDNA